MAQKKAGEVEVFIERPGAGSFPIVLLYGPDPGLVSERAERLAERCGVDRADPFATVLLGADSVEKDIGRLFDEVRTVSMFGGRRLVRVRGSGGGKNLADAVADLAADPPADATVVIEAGDLKKNAPLRQQAERGKASMALPCYPDDGPQLDRMIDAELAEHGLAMDRAAREALKSRLGADRLVSRGEIRKLCLYAAGRKTIAEADVEAVVGDVSRDTVDAAVDAASSGEVKLLPELVARLVGSGVAPFQLQQALQRQFQQILLMRQEVEEGNATPQAAVERRRLHFSRRGAMETAIAAWTAEGAADMLARIEAGILLGRREGALVATIAARDLMQIGVETARRRRRRRN